MLLQCVIISFLLSLSTAADIVRRKGGGIGESTIFQCTGGTVWDISNGESPAFLTNIQQDDDILRINSIVAKHEGNYTCNDKTHQLIVLAVVKFRGENCLPYQDCDLGVISTLPEGQPIPLNISYDFVNGGPRGENQTVPSLRFKQDGLTLLSCGSSGCSIPNSVSNVVKSPGSNFNNIQANVTDDRPINISRVFVAELDISLSNEYQTRTATFTVNVTSTSTVLPASSSMVTSDDTTSSSVVVVPMTSTILIDPPLTSTALIPSPSPTTSSVSSSSTSESVLSQPSSSSSDKPETSSSSFLSSSPSSSTSSSISSSSSTMITIPPVPTSILDDPEDHVVLASILAAFIITIIVIVIFLTAFLILYNNSKRSTSVSSDVINNSRSTLDRLPEIIIEQSKTEMTSTPIYAEIKTVNDEMASHNVIRNIHYVSNGSSSSSITDGQSYQESPYDIPPVNRELGPDLNSVWTPTV